MKISIELETVDDMLVRHILTAQADGDDKALEELWDEAQEAIIDAIRSEFHPGAIKHVIE